LRYAEPKGEAGSDRKPASSSPGTPDEQRG
jgi:hypothetical protein